ncbi:hypothetical protein HAX54_027732, partial [Datura stramonium]|nr:hypothetical protein [Datura stramonium]
MERERGKVRRCSVRREIGGFWSMGVCRRGRGRGKDREVRRLFGGFFFGVHAVVRETAAEVSRRNRENGVREWSGGGIGFRRLRCLKKWGEGRVKEKGVGAAALVFRRRGENEVNLGFWG